MVVRFPLGHDVSSSHDVIGRIVVVRNQNGPIVDELVHAVRRSKFGALANGENVVWRISRPAGHPKAPSVVNGSFVESAFHLKGNDRSVEWLVNVLTPRQVMPDLDHGVIMTEELHGDVVDGVRCQHLIAAS